MTFLSTAELIQKAALRKKKKKKNRNGLTHFKVPTKKKKSEKRFRLPHTNPDVMALIIPDGCSEVALNIERVPLMTFVPTNHRAFGFGALKQQFSLRSDQLLSGRGETLD